MHYPRNEYYGLFSFRDEIFTINPPIPTYDHPAIFI